MSITTVILTILIVIALFFKFNTIKKKGIKTVLKQKVIMLSIVGLFFGTYYLFNPDFQFKNPKDIIVKYISIMVGDEEQFTKTMEG